MLVAQKLSMPDLVYSYSTSSHFALSLSKISRNKRIGGMPWSSS